MRQRNRAHWTLESLSDAIVCTDALGNVTYLNAAAEAMTGYTRDEALGKPHAEVIAVEDSVTGERLREAAVEAMACAGTVGHAAACMVVDRGDSRRPVEYSVSPLHDRAGRVAGAVLQFRDAGRACSRAADARQSTQFDALTLLPSRALLTQRLACALALAVRRRGSGVLMFLDLDRFKTVNDTLGHAVGDELLRSVATRLTQCVRATDTVARLGGDEFVILLTEVEHAHHAADVAEKILAAFAEPRMVCGFELHITVSIGISVFPEDGSSVDAVMRNADVAMYHAKGSGRNSYQFFTADMNRRAIERLGVESSLRNALKHGELLLHYHSKMDLKTGAMMGVEALVRRRGPADGLIYPDAFISVAEDSGLIVPMGRWVLQEACAQVRAWQDAGLAIVPVAVNVSAAEFRHRDFLCGVKSTLENTGLPAHFLELELTESLLMKDTEASVSLLGSLKAMGVRIAIDDFGTGSSSLGYLKRFPIDTLKIDRSFVQDLAVDAGSASIVSAVIGLGKSLGQHVLAEGVETRQQLDFLRARHCDQGQGFQFSRPLPASGFAQLLAPEPQCAQAYGPR
jgi:diguanylate cyclase (GGDEF)-like protein/PAS domain S-box-containing protein